MHHRKSEAQDQSKDHYQILELSYEATWEEVQKASRRLGSQYSNNPKKLGEIEEAYLAFSRSAVRDAHVARSVTPAKNTQEKTDAVRLSSDTKHP